VKLWAAISRLSANGAHGHAVQIVDPAGDVSVFGRRLPSLKGQADHRDEWRPGNGIEWVTRHCCDPETDVARLS
jgi:hypothetical protein